MSRLPEYFARARLALRYRGILGIAWRLLTAPLRRAGLIGSGKKGSEHQRAVWWYEEHAAPVTVIVGGDGARAARAARRATKRLAVDVQVIAAPGACLYLRRDAVERVGPFDEALPLPWAAIDWSLRAWKDGLRVNNFPSVTVTQLAPPREPDAPGADAFWTRWRDWLERRDVRTPEGKLRVAYVTEDTGVGGGHRVVFEHLNRLAARGHRCELYSLDGPPDWFDLRVPVRTFRNYRQLAEALSHEDAIKVATWWATAPHVWI